MHVIQDCLGNGYGVRSIQKEVGFIPTDPGLSINKFEASIRNATIIGLAVFLILANQLRS